MKEYIECRDCDTRSCAGCNLFILSNMLRAGKFDGIMDGNRTIKRAADVVERKRGEWVDKPNPQWKAYDIRHCSVCGWSIHKSKLRNTDLDWHFCPNCGADMRSHQNILCDQTEEGEHESI